MAIVGLSHPKFAIYSAVGNTVNYYGGGTIAKATSASVEIESSEDNNLYADNAVAETDRQFTGGTITLGTDDLSQSVSAAILGLRQQALPTIEGITDTGLTETIYDDNQVTPYLGIGFIRKKIRNGVSRWQAIVLTKIMFSVPSDSADTQGETIEWQTPEISGSIMKDDSATHMWKRTCTFSTEAQADAYVDYILNIPGAATGVGTLTVTSAAGTSTGQTVLTVSSQALDGQSYVYQTNVSEVTLPTEYGETMTGWTAWDGVSPITATNGNQIGVVIVDSNNGAISAGSTTVVAKEA